MTDYCKRCSRCFTRKPAMLFAADERTRDGLTNECAACIAEPPANVFGRKPRRKRATKAKSKAQPRPSPRVRWGQHLVCDCEPARLRPNNKVCVCGLPVVACMAPELRERMAIKAPQTITQTVIAYEAATV